MLTAMVHPHKNMDISTIAAGQTALSTLLFSALNDVPAPAATRRHAEQYWRATVLTPWRAEANSAQRDHARDFFSELNDPVFSSALRERWRGHFDLDMQPLSQQVALDFLTDFFRALLHKPRSYHDFFCQQHHLSNNHWMDFPLSHPLAVDFWTLYVTRQGHGVIHLANAQHQLAEGVAALIPPGCRCSVRRKPDTASWRFDWLNFRTAPQWFELMDWAFSVDQPMLVSLDNTAVRKEIYRALDELESTGYQRGDINERLCHNLIVNVLLRLRRADANDGTRLHCDPRVTAIVRFLLPRYRERLTLDDIASHAKLSPGRLNALFRQHYGISVIRWRDNMRMQKARELLMHSSSSINDIAHAIGFDDPLYFSRRFRKEFGVAPSTLRKR